MKNTFDIIVLGAGMVGASAALMFAKKGYSVAIVERQSTAPECYQLNDEMDLRQSAISPSSQRLLNDLGVWSTVQKKRYCDYQKMTVWHEFGGAEMNFACEQIGASHLGSIVENRLLQGVLLQQLTGLSNADLINGQAITEIHQHENKVEVVTSKGIKLEAGLLIAADGRDSTASRLLNLSSTGGSYHQTAIVANVTTEMPHQHTAWQRFLSTGPVAFLPLANGQCSIVWSADSERAAALMALDEKQFLWQLTEAFESRLGKVVDTSKRAAFPLNWHSADRWLEGRVLLIGDAAHGVHPLAGQGVNLGFGDVALLEALYTQNQSVYCKKSLRKFERQRKAETVTATHLFSALKTIYAQQNPFFCLVRDLGMSVVENSQFLKRAVVQNAIDNLA